MLIDQVALLYDLRRQLDSAFPKREGKGIECWISIRLLLCGGGDLILGYAQACIIPFMWRLGFHVYYSK